MAREIPVQKPLTLIMDIKSPRDAEELTRNLPALHQQLEEAFERTGKVHFARFVLLQNRTQLGIITTFDDDIESYVRSFFEEAPEVFDKMLTHIKDAPSGSVKDDPGKFIEFAKQRNVEPITFYSAYPTKRVGDIK